MKLFNKKMLFFFKEFTVTIYWHFLSAVSWRVLTYSLYSYKTLRETWGNLLLHSNVLEWLLNLPQVSLPPLLQLHVCPVDQTWTLLHLLSDFLLLPWSVSSRYEISKQGNNFMFLISWLSNSGPEVLNCVTLVIYYCITVSGYNW